MSPPCSACLLYMVFEPEIYLQVDAFDDIDIRIRILKAVYVRGCCKTHWFYNRYPTLWGMDAVYGMNLFFATVPLTETEDLHGIAG